LHREADRVSEREPQQPAQITAERALAVVDYRAGYQGLINSFRAVANQRRIAITSADVDETAGTARYFIAKLLSPNAMRDGRNVRRFGAASLGGLLGVKLVVVEDPEALARYTSRLPTRNESCVHNVLTVMGGHGKKQPIPVKLLRRISPSGVAARQAKLSPAERSQIATIAVKARWAKVRAAKAAAKAAKRRAAPQAEAA
jgi:hypothetical protein